MMSTSALLENLDVSPFDSFLKDLFAMPLRWTDFQNTLKLYRKFRQIYHNDDV